MKKLLIFAILPLVFSCSKTPTAQEIIDRSIDAHGYFENPDFQASFRFRDIDYKAKFKEGTFIYERVMVSEKDTIRDILDNNGIIRLVNGKVVDEADTMLTKYANSVNSVIYFALLPRALNDPAVNKELLGTFSIDGHNYYKIGVSFSQEQGGDDFQDEYVYWIDEETYAVHYLAYNYETDGGGARFRKVSKTHNFSPYILYDYENYEADEYIDDIENLDSVFASGSLELLSHINLENIIINPL